MRISRDEAFKAADMAFAVADESTPDMIEAFGRDCCDCCGGVGATGMGAEAFESSYSQKLAGLGFDPTIIITIINIIMGLFKDCPKPPTASQVRHRFGNRLRVARAIREAA